MEKASTMYIRIINKVFILIDQKISNTFSWLVTWTKFKLNGVIFANDFITRGVPGINISLKGKCTFGKGLTIKNDHYTNMIGRTQHCTFVVTPNGHLQIGDNVGISNSSFFCAESIVIGNHVKIGGNTVIYDTDFHSLDYARRSSIPEDLSDVKAKPVTIGDYAFIGAHSTILKGVTIGDRAIVGAGSVVTRNIPAGEVWAGNPAKFIRNI